MPPQTDPLAGVTDMPASEALPGLFEVWAANRAQIHRLQVANREVEKAIDAAMEADRVEEFETLAVKATRKTGIVWYDDKLDALREFLSPEEWEAMLTKERLPPPRRVDRAKAKKLAKQGGRVREIIEAAQTRGFPELRIEVIRD